MKKLAAPLMMFLFATMATQAKGATILGIDGLTLLTAGDSVTSSANFVNATSPVGTFISAATLQSDLTDTNFGTFVLSPDPVADINMAFNSNFYNGAGFDLAFFFAGSTDPVTEQVNIDFGLSINGITNTYTPMITPIVTNITDSFGSYTVTVALVDLDDFGLGFASTTALAGLDVLVGREDSLNFAPLSMVGGFYTTPVPLPLPIILFASGLGVLGMFARRKNQQKV